MKNKMALNVSEKIFEERFTAQVEVDSITNTNTPDKLRGKIDPKKKKFHVFIAGSGPENFTTVFSGKYDRKELTYSVTAPKATKIMLISASVFWMLFAFVLISFYGAVGMLMLLAIPIMLVPFLKKKDKNSVIKLEKRLRKLCLAEPEDE